MCTLSLSPLPCQRGIAEITRICNRDVCEFVCIHIDMRREREKREREKRRCHFVHVVRSESDFLSGSRSTEDHRRRPEVRICGDLFRYLCGFCIYWMKTSTECRTGFDTATKIYSNLIGNIATDALSAKKYCTPLNLRCPSFFLSLSL